MLEKVFDHDGKIVSYCEYSLVNKQGLPSEIGTFIYVFDIWTHKDYRHKGFIRRYINDIVKKHPTADNAYWKRFKYGDRIKLFKKEKIHG